MCSHISAVLVTHAHYVCLFPPSAVILLCGLLLLTICIAVLNTLVPLWLNAEHIPVWQAMVGGIDCLAILPLLFTRLPRLPPAEHPVPVWKMLRHRGARLGIHGCIISGIILGSLYGLLPLYLSHSGTSDADVGFWMALLIGAGIVGQWPVRRLADRYGRLLVLRVLVFIIIVASVVLIQHDELVTMNQALLLKKNDRHPTPLAA